MRIRNLMVLLTIILQTLTSCGNPNNAIPTIATGLSSQPNVDSSAQSTITMAVYDYEIGTYSDLIQTFHAQHPDINVVLVNIDTLVQSQPNANGEYPSESPTDYLRKVAIGADVFPSTFLTPESLGTPLVLNLQPFLQTESTGVKADYFPGLLERYNTEQGLFQLPRAVLDIRGLGYNRDLFDDNNINIPSTEWNAAELFATAERLAQRENGVITRYGWFDDSGGANTLLYLADIAGFDLLDASRNSPKNSETQIIDLYRQYKDLVDRGAVVTQDSLFASQSNSIESEIDPTQLILSGKVGMWTDSILSDPSITPTFNQGFAPLPAGSHLRLPFSIEGYAASGGTQSPQQVWILLDWLTQQIIPSSFFSYDIPGYMMARKSLHAKMFVPTDENSNARILSYQAVMTQLANYTEFPLNDDNLLASLVYGTAPMFESPPQTPLEAFYLVVNEYEEAKEENPSVEPSPTADTSPFVVATPISLSARPDQVTVNYAAIGYSATEVYRQLRGFEEVHPEIFVNVIATDTYTSIPTIADMATTTDCFWWDNYIPYSNTDVAALADVNPIIYANTDFQLEKFAPAIVDFFERDGRLIGIPQSFSTRGLVYNPDLFDRVGITAPQSDWKPEDFLQAARALTGNGVYGYSSMDNYVGDIEFWARQFGGKLSSIEEGKIVTHFGDANTVAAIRWYAELATLHKVMPMPAFDYRRDSAPSTQDPSYELQSQGRIAMWFDTSLGDYAADANDPSAPQAPFLAQFAPLPNGDQGIQSADYTVAAWYISANTRQADACLQLISYLNNTSTLSSPLYGYIPADVELATSPTFLQNNSFTVPLAEALNPVLTRRRGVYNGDVYSTRLFEPYWLFEALSAIVYNNADPQVALKRAESITNAYHDCTFKNNQNVSGSAECALLADPKYQGYLSTASP